MRDYSRAPDAAHAISAFTRVFDALWWCAADPGPTCTMDPGSAEQREERCTASGTRPIQPGHPSMNLSHLLNARRAAGKPVRVALIGAGKFGSMFLSQVPHTPGLEVPVIIDLDRDRAREACRTVGWDEARIAATAFTDDGARAIAGGAMDVVVEATGNPAVGIRHARAAIAAGKHIVMVNVEADVLAG